MSFQEQMLDETFELARLGLNNAVLLNGAAATSLLALAGLGGTEGRDALLLAVMWFGSGAGLGGLASVLAYFGQRCNWEFSKDEERRRGWKRAADLLIWPSVVVCLVSYATFARGAWLTADALKVAQ